MVLGGGASSRWEILVILRQKCNINVISFLKPYEYLQLIAKIHWKIA